MTTDKLTQEKELLQDIAKRPPLRKALGYIKLTGPGLLQSAMTLGAGSAAASVVAGASFGYKLLWVQPVAIFLGILMFAAVSNVVLSKPKDRPYWSFMREMNNICQPFILFVFLWAVGTITASIIWHFPQYGLAAGAARSVVQQFVPDIQLTTGKKIDQRLFYWAGPVVKNEKGETAQIDEYTGAGFAVSAAAGAVILLINIIAVFSYGRGGVGIKIYEWFLRCMIALTFLTFLLVILVNFREIQWLEMLKGFIGWYGIPSNDNPAEYAKTITVVLGMIGATVGINMTFLYPYSLLKKGWGEEHKTLAKWDLVMTMFIPVSVVTSLIMLGMTVSGIYQGEDIVNSTISPLAAAAALHSDGFISEKLATAIFCGGLFGMTCGAVSAHMTCCGFTWCEMLGLEQTKWRFRLFALTPCIGVFGVIVPLPFWFPVAASAICLTMLPIAYFLFFMLSNNRYYIGDAVNCIAGKGIGRWIFNLFLIIALLMATAGACVKLKSSVYDKIFPPQPKTAAAEKAS
ncbi:MAG: divalent metal cation transporter [Planctomycetaceae bacterium]|jgi:Mn2+/Fe2+ NRAMP family transporter|nr:divalent metal cation transporter [Planctomycetaceae bacterium]